MLSAAEYTEFDPRMREQAQGQMQMMQYRTCSCCTPKVVAKQPELKKPYEYQKAKKLLTDRKRRDKMNRCLDELKDLLMEPPMQQYRRRNAGPMRKTEILDMAVRYLHDQRQRDEVCEDTFRAGFAHCITEVSVHLVASPSVTNSATVDIIRRLNARMHMIDDGQSSAAVATAASVSQSTATAAATVASAAATAAAAAAIPPPAAGREPDNDAIAAAAVWRPW